MTIETNPHANHDAVFRVRPGFGCRVVAMAPRPARTFEPIPPPPPPTHEDAGLCGRFWRVQRVSCQLLGSSGLVSLKLLLQLQTRTECRPEGGGVGGWGRVARHPSFNSPQILNCHPWLRLSLSDNLQASAGPERVSPELPQSRKRPAAKGPTQRPFRPHGHYCTRRCKGEERAGAPEAPANS